MDDPPTGLLVVLRFDEAGDRSDDFLDEARAALAVLAEQPGFDDGWVGRATDDPRRWAMALRWQSVGAYRRALSAFPVKLHAVPLLSRAIDEPTAFEVLEARGARHASSSSARADDADTVPVGGVADPATD
jgi:hypothetical protein